MRNVLEFRKLDYKTFAGSPPAEDEVRTHGLKITMGLAEHFFDPEDYDEHEVVISIRKNKWGFCMDNSSTFTVANGFDPDAGTPPDSTSSGEWMRINGPVRTPNQVSDLNLAYFTDPEGDDALGGSVTERIVYRESAKDEFDVEHTVVYVLSYGILKNMAVGDCPIDTRKTFNASNEGNVVDWFADGNTLLRNLNFDPYIFRGGLFIGNIPWQKRDRSGTARLQLWFDDFDLSPYEELEDPPTLQFATTTIWDNGTIPSEAFSTEEWDDDFELTYYHGATGSSEATTTWAEKWDTAPPSSPPNGLYTANVLDWSPATQDYVNMRLTEAEPDEATTNAAILKWIYAKCKLEDSFISGATMRWRYFLSKEGAGEGDPGDKAPRCWGIWGISFMRTP